MGFGLPSALGAAAAHDGRNGRPKRVVVDIDGDGSFLMNCQELATAAIEKLNCKVGGSVARGGGVLKELAGLMGLLKGGWEGGGCSRCFTYCWFGRTAAIEKLNCKMGGGGC